MTRYRISILIAAAGLFAAPRHAALNVQHQAGLWNGGAGAPAG